MRVKVVLHSYLREKLPAEARGRAEMELPEGSTAGDVFRMLDLPVGAAWAINGKIERDLTKGLADGDEVRVFRQGAGGSGFNTISIRIRCPGCRGAAKRKVIPTIGQSAAPNR